jgi:hypothetical protein
VIVVASNLPADTKEGLRDRVSDLNPALVLLKKVDVLAKDDDALTDLTQEQITGIAALEAADTIGLMKIPGTLHFIQRFERLMQSKDRLGRFEYRDVLKGRSVVQTAPGGTGTEVTQAPQGETAARPKRSLWDRIRGRS